MNARLTPISNDMDDAILNAAIDRNDAIEAIRDGVSREDYIRMHKAKYQAKAAGWYDAVRGGA